MVNSNYIMNYGKYDSMGVPLININLQKKTMDINLLVNLDTKKNEPWSEKNIYYSNSLLIMRVDC